MIGALNDDPWQWEVGMRDDCVTLHLTRRQRETIRRQTGKDPTVLMFRLGELCQRIAMQEESENECEEARLEDLIHSHT
jgi:hypothetical protein